MEIIDVTISLNPELPVWPGSKRFSISQIKQIGNKSFANVSKINFEVHTGTHVDAQSHFIVNGKTVEAIPLDILIGTAVVVDCQDVDVITADFLEQLVLPENTVRLLFRTKNSDIWVAGHTEFTEDFVALSVDAATWIVEHNIKLVGIDYLSIQRYSDGPETHQVLLSVNIIIIEGLDLSQVTSGEYELICLPLKISGAEGSPARVVLRTLR